MVPQIRTQAPELPFHTPMPTGTPTVPTATALARAVSYLRVSGKGQLGGDGFPRQRAAIALFAATRGIELVDEFRDEGVSGTLGLADRPGLSALLEATTAAGIRTVLIEKADRLARDLVESELLLRTFRELSICVIEADGGNDLTSGGDASPTAVLIRQVLGAISQFDRAGLTAKLRAARDRIRRDCGRCEGPRRYGDRPEEVAAVRRLLELAASPDGGRRSLAEIAAALNAEGVPTRRGRPWARSTVRKILARHRSTDDSVSLGG